MIKEETFGSRIKHMRMAKGFTTQEEFAKAVGVSRVTMNYYENNERKPDYEIFGKIAETLGVTCEYLLGITKTPYKENEATVKKLGLSDKAINILERVANKKIDGITSATVNRLFANEVAFIEFFKPFELYIQSIFKLYDKMESVEGMRILEHAQSDEFFNEDATTETDLFKIKSIYEIIPKGYYPYIKHTYETAMQKALFAVLNKIEEHFLEDYLE